jgi:hypothetical protein
MHSTSSAVRLSSHLSARKCRRRGRAGANKKARPLNSLAGGATGLLRVKLKNWSRAATSGAGPDDR